MTLENKVKKFTSALGLTLALATYTCGGTESKSDDDNNKSDWPACELKNYVDRCDHFTGTYEVKESSCSLPYGKFSFNTFQPDPQVNPEGNCSIAIAGIDKKTEELECLRPDNGTQFYSYKSNQVTSKDGNYQFRLCNPETLRIVWNNGECEAWATKTSNEPIEPYMCGP
ncbi:MAG: hypothetical protein KKA58_04990 [Nanoarchaeota archaeon]|nr:hypothetical protein [Nanoarchaeota archaeon]